MIRKILLFGFLILLSSTLGAQKLFDEESYYAFKTSDWKGNAAPNLIKIYPIQNPTNGMYLLRDESNKPLNGCYHIVIHMHKYIVANISKGILNGDFELYSYNSLSEKYNYKQGKYDGKQYLYSKNATYTYDNGVKTHYIAFHPNEQLEEEVNYVNGKLDGEVAKYDKEGKIMSRQYYINGVLDGEELVVGSNGYTRISNYKNGSISGDYKEIYSNGNIAIKGTYTDKMKKNGLWLEYKEDGKIKREASYLDDLLHGEKKDYDKGVLYQSCEYANGKKNGKRKYFNGEAPYLWLSEEEDYVNDRLDGLFKRYNERNILYMESEYKQGGKTKDKEYDMTTGIIMTETLYRDGKRIAQKEYNNKGVLQALKLANERGSLVYVKEYNTKGQVIKTDTTYKNTPIIKLVEDEWGIIDISK